MAWSLTKFPLFVLHFKILLKKLEHILCKLTPKFLVHSSLKFTNIRNFRKKYISSYNSYLGWRARMLNTILKVTELHDNEQSSTNLPVLNIIFGWPIFTDYENKAYLDQNLIKLLSITIDSIETIFE
jgi:hypothetical protein